MLHLKFLLSNIFIVLCLGVFGLFLYRTTRDLYYARQSVQWPSVQGTIAVSEVRGTRSTRSSLIAYVRYYYRVNGNRYRSVTIMVGSRVALNRAEADAVVARYQAGDTVRVFYHPDNPQMSCLEPGRMFKNSYLGVLVTSVATLLSSGWLIVRYIIALSGSS